MKILPTKKEAAAFMATAGTLALANFPPYYRDGNSSDAYNYGPTNYAAVGFVGLCAAAGIITCAAMAFRNCGFFSAPTTSKKPDSSTPLMNDEQNQVVP